MLAVFERLDVALLRRLLGTATGNPEMALLAFANQVSGRGAGSVPDGTITGNFCYYLEVRPTATPCGWTNCNNTLTISTGRFGTNALFVLTPDRTEPPQIRQFADARVTWFTFRDLADTIDAALADRYVELPELQRYLLRELLALFDRDGLLSAVDTVVVPVNAASIDLYLRQCVYLCQPGRSISEQVQYVGFYGDGEIKPFVARILLRQD